MSKCFLKEVARDSILQKCFQTYQIEFIPAMFWQRGEIFISLQRFCEFVQKLSLGISVDMASNLFKIP